MDHDSGTKTLTDANRHLGDGPPRLLNARSAPAFVEVGALCDEVSAVGSAVSGERLYLVHLDRTDDRVFDDMRLLRRRNPRIRVVALDTHLCVGRLCDAVRAGASGYLLKDIAPEALVQSLRVVMTGEMVFPTRLADLLCGDGLGLTGNQEPDRTASLSWRETDLLHGLQTGKSNRGIAADLRISEAEVRANLRSLLRKLNLANRTQAAVWAANHGIRPSHHNPGGAFTLV